MQEEDADWERAYLRVVGNGVDEDNDWERAHLIWWEWCGGEGRRLRESALESESGVGERDADWERAHLIVEGNEWGRETPTGRERT